MKRTLRFATENRKGKEVRKWSLVIENYPLLPFILILLVVLTLYVSKDYLITVVKSVLGMP